MTTPIASPIVAAIEKAYASARRRHPDLPEQIVFILGDGTTRSGVKLGHYHAGQWAYRIPGTVDAPVSIPEVLISGQCLSEGGAQVMQTVLHEAVHALAVVRKIKDTSRQGRWHNKKFVTLANELGLVYPHDKPDHSIGFSHVIMTEETQGLYAKQIEALDKAISVAKAMGFDPDNTPEPPPLRIVAVVVFEDGTEIELGMKTYEKLADHLLPHEMHEEER